MNKKFLTLILGIVVFLDGFVLLSIVILGVNGKASDTTITIETVRSKIVNTGSQLFNGMS